jgi:hypothetical protein
MKITIGGVKEGTLFPRRLARNSAVMKAVPEDGLIIGDEAGKKLYVRLSDLDEALVNFGPDLSMIVDPWRDNGEETPTTDVPAGTEREP